MTDDFSAAVSTAVSEAKNETGSTTEPVKETAPAAAPVKEEAPVKDAAPVKEAKPAAKPAPKADDDDEETFVPSAADLEAINKNPELRRVYKSMQKGYTQKTTKLANDRKNLEEKAQLADYIQQNPDEAVREIARLRGISIPQAKVEGETRVADGLEAKWAETVGPEAAKLLRPLFEETAKALIQAEVAPLRASTEGLSKAAAERGIAAATREFGAGVVERGDPWDDAIQVEMAEVMGKIAPGDDTPIDEYLTHIYDVVAHRRARKAGLKRELTRLREARDEAEPVNPSRPAPDSDRGITADMSDSDAVAAAVRMARASIAR